MRPIERIFLFICDEVCVLDDAYCIDAYPAGVGRIYCIVRHVRPCDRNYCRSAGCEPLRGY